MALGSGEKSHADSNTGNLGCLGSREAQRMFAFRLGTPNAQVADGLLQTPTSRIPNQHKRVLEDWILRTHLVGAEFALLVIYLIDGSAKNVPFNRE